MEWDLASEVLLHFYHSLYVMQLPSGSLSIFSDLICILLLWLWKSLLKLLLTAEWGKKTLLRGILKEWYVYRCLYKGLSREWREIKIYLTDTFSPELNIIIPVTKRISRSPPPPPRRWNRQPPGLGWPPNSWDGRGSSREGAGAGVHHRQQEHLPRRQERSDPRRTQARYSSD